jgi:threonine dehydrogenase-like Zn-dependent dehydrogenase
MPARPGAVAESMPVAVSRGQREVVVEHRPVPSAGEGQVLVEVDHCGICGSDLHLLVEGWGPPGTVGGHEFSGTVAALGPGVAGWSPGDAVVGGPQPRCGRCRRCREGTPSQCEERREALAAGGQGAFARYVVVDAGALRKVPPGIPLRRAALAEPLAVALHALSRARLEPEDTAMVFGAGPIGALAVAALVRRGHEVAVVEPNPGRRNLAARLGASVVLEPGGLERFGPAEPERLAAGAVDVVLECSGRKEAVELAQHQLRRGGRLVLVGAGMGQPRLDPNRVLLNELDVCGSFLYDADGFERAFELLADPAWPTGLLVEEHDVTLDELGDALTALAEGRLAGKVMVVPRTSQAVRG